MPYVSLKNGLKVYYEQTGKGPDLVFISGLACDHTMWDVSKFTDKFRVLTFDNRGIGLSDVPDKPYTMQAFCEDTVLLCEAVGIKKAHFVGHSMGSHVVQLIGAQHPQLADKLILTCSEPEISPVCYLATKCQIELRSLQIPKRLLVEVFLPLILSSGFLQKKSQVEKFIQDRLNQPNPQSDKGYMGQVEALRTHNTRALLAKIKNPTLVLGCEEDLLTPFKNSEYLKEHIPNAEFAVIKNSGHVVFVEAPEEFIQTIRDFLLK